VCACNQDLEMRIRRVVFRLSGELHDTDEVQAIDATGMDRIAASQHYPKLPANTTQNERITRSRR